MIIGLDVGGTHTDVVLLGPSGILREIKVPTNPENLLESVLSGLDAVTDGIPLEKITRVVLSTTLTTNAVIQKKFPPVGMIVMAGPGIHPDLYRTGDHYHVVSGALDHRGREVAGISPSEIRGVADTLARAQVRLVGVVGKFSVKNPAHELAVKKILGDAFDRVVLSHEISGQLNFPRRIATTYLNAAVYPIHKTFFEAVENALACRGLSIPLRVLKPDGGNMNLKASANLPGNTILSGPAASVMGALPHAAQDRETLVLDIGGTTTDMAILIQGVPLLDPMGIDIAGFKTNIRAIKALSVGIGGDSLVAVHNGSLSIGPGRLGPAMAFGGEHPTPTDALVFLGKIKAGDPERAAQGIHRLAEALGVSSEETAFAVFDQVCRDILAAAQNMIDAINGKPVYTVHEMLDTYQVTPREILVLGGPAACFAEHLSALSGLPARAVPHWQVANAIGAAMARTTCDVTLFADTQLGTATAPEENFVQKIGATFTRDNAETLALALLREKAMAMGAEPEHMTMEVIEAVQFNMVRGFSTTGKNIRIKAQLKPGLVSGLVEG